LSQINKLEGQDLAAFNEYKAQNLSEGLGISIESARNLIKFDNAMHSAAIIASAVVGQNSVKSAGKGTTLPNGYTSQGANVVGPKGGVYTHTGKFDAAGNPIYTNNGAYYTFENGAKTKVPSPNTNTSSQVQQNYQQGKQYEQTKYDEFSSTQEKSAREVTLETENGTKIRLDMIGKDKNGNITCIECKSSDKAPLTHNQKVGFPDLEKNGGTIIGDGKPGFEGGTKIPPTKVEVVRPDN
jgi:filamentous hemagglutinin